MTTLGVRADSIVDEFLTARLNGDATLRSVLNVPTGSTRVANMLAPKEWGDGPFVVFDMSLPMRTEPRPIDAAGARIFSAGMYRVFAMGRPSAWGTITKAANRLDALLEGAKGTTSTGEVYTFHHVEAYRLYENDTPEQPPELRGVWLRVGALWRVQVS